MSEYLPFVTRGPGYLNVNADHVDDLDISIGDCRWTYTPDGGWKHQCDPSTGDHLEEPQETWFGDSKLWSLNWVVENND